MVESDTARVSDLPMVESDTARVSVLPVAGCKFPAVFFGTTSTEFRQMDDIPHVIGAVKLECSTVWGFPRLIPPWLAVVRLSSMTCISAGRVSPRLIPLRLAVAQLNLMT